MIHHRCSALALQKCSATILCCYMIYLILQQLIHPVNVVPAYYARKTLLCIQAFPSLYFETILRVKCLNQQCHSTKDYA